jgi:hypothetical protein
MMRSRSQPGRPNTPAIQPAHGLLKDFTQQKRSRRVFICLDSKKPGNLDSLNRFRFPLGFHQEGLGRGFRAKFDYYLDIVGEFSQTGSVLIAYSNNLDPFSGCRFKQKVPVWQQILVEKIVQVSLCFKYVSSSKVFEFDCLPTDKVVRYKNKPDLQWFYLFNEP